MCHGNFEREREIHLLATLSRESRKRERTSPPKNSLMDQTYGLCTGMRLTEATFSHTFALDDHTARDAPKKSLTCAAVQRQRWDVASSLVSNVFMITSQRHHHNLQMFENSHALRLQ